MVAITTVLIASCQHPDTIPPFKTKRVVVLETNTVSFVHIPKALDSVYRIDDTVWVNLVTHKIDDLDTNTMMSVIKP